MRIAITSFLLVLGTALIAYGWFRYRVAQAALKTEMVVKGRLASFENRKEVVVGGGVGYDTSRAQLWWIIEYTIPNSGTPRTLTVRDVQLRHIDNAAVGTPVDIAVDTQAPEQARLYKSQGDRAIYLSLFGMGTLLILFAILAWRS